jgi:hypothetical protein
MAGGEYVQKHTEKGLEAKENNEHHFVLVYCSGNNVRVLKRKQHFKRYNGT